MAGEPWLAPALGYAVSWLGFQREQLQQPGFAVAVAHEGRIVLDHAEGAADLATGEALTPRHRMRIASHSKTFTAAAILALVEEGRLRLDDRCGARVEGIHPSVAAATIGQLLSHSGGITGGTGATGRSGAPSISSRSASASSPIRRPSPRPSTMRARSR